MSVRLLSANHESRWILVQSHHWMIRGNACSCTLQIAILGVCCPTRERHHPKTRKVLYNRSVKCLESSFLVCMVNEEHPDFTAYRRFTALPFQVSLVTESDYLHLHGSNCQPNHFSGNCGCPVEESSTDLERECHSRHIRTIPPTYPI